MFINVLSDIVQVNIIFILLLFDLDQTIYKINV